MRAISTHTQQHSNTHIPVYTDTYTKTNSYIYPRTKYTRVLHWHACTHTEKYIYIYVYTYLHTPGRRSWYLLVNHYTIQGVEINKCIYSSVCIGWWVGVMVIVVENGDRDPSSNLKYTICISHNVNTFGKGMNPIIFSPAMG